jgi:hypothetical protein
MMKGRFLGIAQNIGDSFCFLILTQPEAEEESSSPQVLARSVIQRRYLRDETPTVDPTQSRSTITFYRNDETTLLADPSPDATDETCNDPVSDIAADSVEELRALLLSQPANGVTQSPDNVDDNIFEVYGPLSERPRRSIDDSVVLPLDPGILDTQTPVMDSEERSSSPTIFDDTVSDVIPFARHDDTNLVVSHRNLPFAFALPAATAGRCGPTGRQSSRCHSS